MTEYSPDQLAPVEAELNAAPSIQAFLQSGNKTALGWARAVAASGVRGVPHDYQPAVQGGRVVLKPLSFIQRNGWFLPAVAVGAPLAAGYGISALAGSGGAPAASAAGAGGVGVGETGAVTGLAGSGFGGAAGGGALAGVGSHLASGIVGRLANAAIPAGLMGLGQLFGAGHAPELPPELRQILDLQKQRMEAQGPLYASILQLAQQRMPTSVQGAQLPAGSGPSTPAIEQLARNRNPNG